MQVKQNYNKFKVLNPAGIYVDFSGIRRISATTYLKINTSSVNLEVTPDHIFMLGHSEKLARDMHIGSLLDINGKLEKVISIKKVILKRPKYFYDLTNVNGACYRMTGAASHNCFTGSSYTLLKSDTIHKLKEFTMSKRWFKPETIKFTAGNYSYNRWFKPEKGHTYIIGADVSDGIGECFSVALVFDISFTKNIKLVASFANNKITTMEFPYVLATFGAIYNNAYIAVEANNMGRAILDTLNMNYNYDNIINYGGKRDMGIQSHLQVKGDACRWLRDLSATDDISFELYDKELVSQIEYFERKTSKKHDIYQASGDKFDDYVHAWLWAMFCIKEEIADNYYTIENYITNVYGMKIPLRIKTYNESYFDVDRSERVFDPKQIDNIYKNLIERGVDTPNKPEDSYNEEEDGSSAGGDGIVPSNSQDSRGSDFDENGNDWGSGGSWM